MGVCVSKQETTPTSNGNMSGTRTVRTKQTTTKTKAQNSTKEKSKKPQPKKSNSEGNVVGTTTNQSKEDRSKGNSADSKLSPKDAARLAAEKRLEEQTKKLAKGQLGKKLAAQKGLKV